MLTSFFGKSSPVNFLLLSIFIVVVRTVQAILFFKGSFGWTPAFVLLGHILASVFAMLLLDFIIRKNALTQSHTLGIFVFCCWMLCLPVLESWQMVVAQLFILLALRRIFSLSSDKKDEKKILDATLWILLASYFYFWSILFFGALYVAISNKNQKPFRYFFIPIVGALGMLLLATAFFFIKENSMQWMSRWPEHISLNYTPYASSKMIGFIAFLLALFSWAVTFRLSNLGEVPRKGKGNYLLVVYLGIMGLFATLFSEVKSTVEWLFFIIPAAVIIAGYLEKKGERWFKELLLWLIMAMPIISLFLR
ncbi:MAG: DUF6427 family protein [Flavobacteriaceae bacterium]